jgi:uncharacterized membrane protein
VFPHDIYGTASRGPFQRQVGQNAPVPPPIVLLVAGIHSPGFDLLLIAHVACALFGFGALAVSGVQAVRLARSDGAEVPPGLRRYFAPGVNWAGRLLYGIPVLGLALLADSGGRFGLDDSWVLSGLLLWVAAATAAEGVLWPAERRIQRTLAETEPAPGQPRTLRRDCVLVATGAAGLAVVFVVGTVVMVARP